jgi:hypothetical protein
MVIANDEFEAAAESIGRRDGRKQLGDDAEHAAFPEMTFFETGLFPGGLRQGGDESCVDPISFEGLAVDDKLVGRSVPDDDGPRAADPVEIGAGQGAMENGVIAPCHQQFGRVLEFRVGVGKPPAIFVGAAGTTPDGKTQSSIAMISDTIVRPVRSG